MEFIPAIDLLDGSCVRLRQGSYSDVDTYPLDPVETAQRFAEAGAKRVHLVDLNAARGSDEDDRRGNREIIRKIAASVDIAVEVGGGIRTEKDVAEILQAGASHVVIGTALARNPQEVASWIRRWGPVFLAGIDARDGLVQVAGWEQNSGITDIQLAKMAAEIGCAGIIYTNIAKDGMMQGPDMDRTNQIAAAAGIPVILSGGISGQQDIEAVIREAHPLLVGIISGRAIYEGALDVGAAVEVVRKAVGTGCLWNFSAYWQPMASRVRPALVIDQNGQTRAAVLQNKKAAAKSNEQGEVWEYIAENGRVLPASLPSHRVQQVKDLGVCTEVRAIFSDEAGDLEGGAVAGVTSAPEADTAAPSAGTTGASADWAEEGRLLARLEQLIQERKESLPEGSYTTHLFTAGEEKIRKKTGEEAVELVLAKTDSDIISESADLVYHLMVLLAQRSLSLQDVIRELSRR